MYKAPFGGDCLWVFLTPGCGWSWLNPWWSWQCRRLDRGLWWTRRGPRPWGWSSSTNVTAEKHFLENDIYKICQLGEHFERGSITVWLTSCLTDLDLAKHVNLLLIKQKQSSWIQTSQTEGQLYNDASPYKVSECSLDGPLSNQLFCLQKLPLLLQWNVPPFQGWKIVDNISNW